jgi:hypothetical protein
VIVCRGGWAEFGEAADEFAQRAARQPEFHADARFGRVRCIDGPGFGTITAQFTVLKDLGIRRRRRMTDAIPPWVVRFAALRVRSRDHPSGRAV